MTTQIQIGPKLLSHPWYQKWECGELSKDALRHYAGQYYWQVSNFPRYLSRLHSQLEDLNQRQVILENLNDEENKTSPHPELWLDFAEGLGLDRSTVVRNNPEAGTRELVEEFHAIVASGPEAGIGAILAYESQVPEVARFKSEALKKFYVTEKDQSKATKFFAVHQEADVWHTQQIESLTAGFSEPQMQLVQQGASRACSALWKFLDGMPN